MHFFGTNIPPFHIILIPDVNECSGNHGCSHGCQNTVGSYQCTCPNGYSLSSNQRTCQGNSVIFSMIMRIFNIPLVLITIIINKSHSFSISDDNECSGNHGCSHGCQNTAGSYQCTCPSGYSLASNQRTCQGIDTSTKSPSLQLFSFSSPSFIE